MKLVSVVIVFVFAMYGPEFCGILNKFSTQGERILWGGVFGGIGGTITYFLGKHFDW